MLKRTLNSSMQNNGSNDGQEKGIHITVDGRSGSCGKRDVCASIVRCMKENVLARNAVYETVMEYLALRTEDGTTRFEEMAQDAIGTALENLVYNDADNNWTVNVQATCEQVVSCMSEELDKIVNDPTNATIMQVFTDAVNTVSNASDCTTINACVEAELQKIVNDPADNTVLIPSLSDAVQTVINTGTVLNVQNGLLQQQDGEIELGGDLIRDTSVNVKNHKLSILDDQGNGIEVHAADAANANNSFLGSVKRSFVDVSDSVYTVQSNDYQIFAQNSVNEVVLPGASDIPGREIRVTFANDTLGGTGPIISSTSDVYKPGQTQLSVPMNGEPTSYTLMSDGTMWRVV